MSEHSVFENAMHETTKMLHALQKEHIKVWEEMNEFCVHREDMGPWKEESLCTLGNKKGCEPIEFCKYEKCPYAKGER